MPTNFENIATENKKLWMELGGLDLKTPEGKARRDEIQKEVMANNRELQAFSAALGSRSDMPRTILYKTKEYNRG